MAATLSRYSLGGTAHRAPTARRPVLAAVAAGTTAATPEVLPDVLAVGSRAGAVVEEGSSMAEAFMRRVAVINADAVTEEATEDATALHVGGMDGAGAGVTNAPPAAALATLAGALQRPATFCVSAVADHVTRALEG